MLNWVEIFLVIFVSVGTMMSLSSIETSLKCIAWAQELTVCVEAAKVLPDFNLPKSCLEGRP